MITRNSSLYLLLIVLLAGYGIPGLADDSDAASLMNTPYQLSADEILFDKSIDTSLYRKALLVKVDSDPGEFTTYFRAAMRETGFFKEVYDEKTFRNVLAFHHPGKGKAFSATSHGIKLASELFGPFLAARLDWENRVYLQQTARISVFDAATGELVFQAEHQATSLSDLEKALLNPLLKAFHNWLLRHAGNQDSSASSYLE